MRRGENKRIQHKKHQLTIDNKLLTTQTLTQSSTQQLVETTLQKHHQYLQQNNYAGWDVFDGLNSRLFQQLPFHNNRLIKLAWIQLFKKSPVNFRKIAKVPKGHNPKALALFISGLINLARYYENDQYIKEALQLSQKLMTLKSSGYAGSGWGYDFPWQARAFYVPEFKPNMVVSTFVGQALLDLFEYTEDEKYLEIADDIAIFILKHLILYEDNSKLCLRYIPGEDTIVHNANLLGASFLSRLFNISKKPIFQHTAEKSVRYSVDAQCENSAWVYGTRKHHQWVDNFHTGYNLVSIYAYQNYCHDYQFEKAIQKGLDYHRKNHFTDDYLPKYSDINLYPIDIHCYSQAIISAHILKGYWPNSDTFLTRLLGNVIDQMFDSSRHYFYYQQNKFITTKIPYIRWSQAWMFYALSYCLAHTSE